MYIHLSKTIEILILHIILPIQTLCVETVTHRVIHEEIGNVQHIFILFIKIKKKVHLNIGLKMLSPVYPPICFLQKNTTLENR